MVISRLTLLALALTSLSLGANAGPRHAPPLVYWTPHDIELRFLRQRTVLRQADTGIEGTRLNGISLRRVQFRAEHRRWH